MKKSTPGPWHYQEESDAYTHIVRGPNNYFITQLSQDTSGRSEADARLMAAAPELLDACRAVLLFHAVEWDEDKRTEWKAITGESEATTKILCDHIRNAIAKARRPNERTHH